MDTTPPPGGAGEVAGNPLHETAGGPAADIDFRIVAEKSLSLIVVTDRAGTVQYVNPMFCWWTGFGSNEVIGRRIDELGQLEPQAVAELWDMLGFGRPWRGELAAKTKDGRSFWFQASISPVTDAAGSVTHFIGVALEISDRKRAEEALRESEERFRKLAETTSAATFILDGPWIRYANSAASRISGYAPDELVGKNFWDLSHPQLQEITAENIRGTTPGGQMPSRAEVGIVTKSGETRWLDLSTGFVELDGRRLVLGTGFDVTARRQTEQELKDSEEKFRTLVDTLPAAAFIFQGTRLRYANRTCYDVLGYSDEDLASLNFWDVLHPDYRDLVRERGIARLRGENVPDSYEVRFLKKGGEARWGFYSGALVTYEGKPAVLGIVYDITERKTAEEALSRSEERYRILYQNNPSMYFTLSADLTILSTNQYGADLLGYSGAELVGRPVSLVVHPEDRDHVLRRLSALVESGGAKHDLEFRKVRKDGGVIWVQESAGVAQDVDGNDIVLMVCEDISERKRIEEELQTLREDVELKAERTIVSRAGPYNLSFREITVLHLIAEGRSDKEVATILGISPQTVSKHVTNLLRKMQASSRTEAGVRALREGLIT